MDRLFKTKKIKPTEMKYCFVTTTLLLLMCSSCVEIVDLDRFIPALNISDEISETSNQCQAIERPNNEMMNRMLQQTFNEAIVAWQECQKALADPNTNHYRLKGVNWASLESGTNRYLFTGVENDGRFTSCEKKNGHKRIYRLATRHNPNTIDYGLMWYWASDKRLEFDKESGRLILFKGSCDDKLFTVRWSDAKITSERVAHKPL